MTARLLPAIVWGLQAREYQDSIQSLNLQSFHVGPGPESISFAVARLSEDACEEEISRRIPVRASLNDGQLLLGRFQPKLNEASNEQHCAAVQRDPWVALQLRWDFSSNLP